MESKEQEQARLEWRLSVLEQFHQELLNCKDLDRVEELKLIISSYEGRNHKYRQGPMDRLRKMCRGER
jgi:hypothetical protein